MADATSGWARVETGWTLAGQPALVLINDLIRVVVLPELGGRVWQITDLSTGVDLLWNNPRLRPAALPFGAGYDDNFLGGWDELFPNDLPEDLAGEPYPDHGEGWSQPWTWQVLPSSDAAVRLSHVTRISGSLLTRTLVLAPGSSALRAEIEVTNGTGAELPMMHKQHLAVALRPGSRLHLPACRIEIGPFGRPRAGRFGEVFDWPGASSDGSPAAEVPDFGAEPGRGTAELLFATELADGWCAVTAPDGTGIGLAFDTAVYPACWTFGSWGGWRGLDVLVLEPCTGTGLSVAEGQATGRHRSLAAGETLRTTLTAHVLSNRSHGGRPA